MKAERHNENKPQWSLLFDYFPLALEELLRARSYGVKKYTDPEKGLDGRTNWMRSICADNHEDFKVGCRESAIRHLLNMAWGGEVDMTQDETHHMAFVALNALMWLEYRMSEDSEKWLLKEQAGQ